MKLQQFHQASKALLRNSLQTNRAAKQGLAWHTGNWKKRRHLSMQQFVHRAPITGSRYFSTEENSSGHSRQLMDPFEQATARLPQGAQIHLDFFGEPVTFFGVDKTESKGSDYNIDNAVASLDGFVIGAVSKGKSFTGGGEEEGVSVQAAHSSALAWAELLRHASLWNRAGRSAPMLAYVAVAPLLAQTGVGYIRYLDKILSTVDSGVDELSSPIQLLALAQQAALKKDDEHLNSREKAHLQALDCMLRHDHKRALVILLRHLQRCPGDGFALSMAMDLAHTTGDTGAALRAGSSVASYWNERRGGILRPSIPGFNTISGLISVGLAVGGRRSEAEQLAVFAMERGEKLAGGVSTWAMAHILDAEGRTAEGISACANSDGSRHFEACGFLFFDSILSGYGVRFALDREERGRGRSKALRLYDNNYERVFDYTGFASGMPDDKPFRKAPMGWRKSKFESAENRKSFMSDLFGKPSPKDEKESSGSDEDQIVLKKSSLPSHFEDNWVPTVEDVLTWLPPTPQLLGDATLLLLRLTLNGTVSTQNYRWENLRNSWSAMIQVQQSHGGKQEGFAFYPLVCVAASLLAAPRHAGTLEGPGDRLAQALHRMGDLLNLGDIAAPVNDEEEEEEKGGFLSTILVRDIVADKEPDFWLPVESEETKENWRVVFKLLASAIDGVYDPTEDNEFDVMRAELSSGYESWEFDVRPFLEHAVVYAACKCGDFDTLSLARAICSRGVTLRPNSPEEWWRYSIVLGLLGDEVASEDALQASLAFGGGQGARRD
eukprot:Nitzschia sp. Nitz4//scaffold260_size33533//26353//28686//NITZ4_007882-RA/size33533-processed-gene-0.3-mRNA-1//1//CDS//3329544692//326//frame0